MTDEEMRKAIRAVFNPKFDSLLESTRAIIEQTDRIADKLDRLNDRLAGHEFS